VAEDAVATNVNRSSSWLPFRGRWVRCGPDRCRDGWSSRMLRWTRPASV